MSRRAWGVAVGAAALALAACGGDDALPAANADAMVTDASLSGNAGGAIASDGASSGVSEAHVDTVDAADDESTPPIDGASTADQTASEESFVDGAPADGAEDSTDRSTFDAPLEGDAPEAAPATTNICALACASTDDCRGDASSSRAVCDTVGHRCVSCLDDLPCISTASGWSKTCTLDADCSALFGDYCVDVGGFGVCAFDQAKIGTLNCPPNAVTYVIAKHGDAGTVNVCAKLTNTCDLLRGRCEGPCTITCTGDGSTCTSTCTPSRGGKICNASTKRCECASNTDCASPTSVCNLATKQCECASGADCAGDATAVLACQ